MALIVEKEKKKTATKHLYCDICEVDIFAGDHYFLETCEYEIEEDDYLVACPDCAKLLPEVEEYLSLEDDSITGRDVHAWAEDHSHEQRAIDFLDRWL